MTKYDGFIKYQISFVDLQGKVITTGLNVTIHTLNSTAATVYADQYETAKTNPITDTVFTAASGVIEFWTTQPSVDIVVMDVKCVVTRIRAVTPSTTRIVLNTNDPYHSDQILFFDDFLGDYVTGDKWTIATDAGGTITIPDAVDGYAQLLTGGTDEDGTTISSTSELFVFQTDKNLYFEARCRCAETDTTNYDANWAIGLSDVVTVDLMAEAAAGPVSSFDGAIFFKKEANKYIEFMASNATDQDENSDMVAFTRNTWYVLSFLYDYNDGTTASITPSVNGTAYDPVDFTIASCAEMHACATVKTAGTQTETFDVDYIRITTKRDI